MAAECCWLQCVLMQQSLSDSALITIIWHSVAPAADCASAIWGKCWMITVSEACLTCCTWCRCSRGGQESCKCTRQQFLAWRSALAC